MADPEMALWRAVISQAFADATSPRQSKEAAFERTQARAWLRGSTADFRYVVALAGLDPAAVRERAERLVAAADRRPTPTARGARSGRRRDELISKCGTAA